MFPKFKRKGNKTLNLTSGESRSIPCQAFGYPRPDVGWIKQDGNALSSRVTQNTMNVGRRVRVSHLTLTNVSF